MSTVSRAARKVAPQSHRDAIDAAGEREAASLDFFEVELDQPAHVSRLAKVRAEADAARARQLPDVVHNRYPRRKAIRQWIAIIGDLAAGRTPRVSKYPPATRVDRQRWADRRAKRAAAFLKLVNGPARLVTLPEAATLIESKSARALYRAKLSGELPVRPGESRGAVVSTRDLATYLGRKLKVA